MTIQAPTRKCQWVKFRRKSFFRPPVRRTRKVAVIAFENSWLAAIATTEKANDPKAILSSLTGNCTLSDYG